MIVAACVISGFRREAEKNCALLGYCAESSGNFLMISRDNITVPSSTVLLKMGPIGCPETSVRD